ncbi:TlyA family RNA methyltransferase [Capillibacterium thermochitinicola]|uniref:TlyA family RNA methyltransferase n=1 Tax=Capillibacterium thermochitinicola TaxID=2699427 RepID=A0A8J6HY21_9FIRM|nr:TlyA family RNA methyltransferase [Capillibacterium thermochitinicola]MBA2131970.1 TlyA family RNA methyltransferase [Capillibacterium thermochitinicola]
MERERIDVLLVGRGLAESRSKAQALIMAGQVRVDGKVVDKPGIRVAADAVIEVDATLPYVSRGGFKLRRALDLFPVTVAGRVCLDAGASTGGFTDCLLQAGAKLVIAVDVGYGQLAWKLRQDPRVVVMEKTNVRYLTVEQLPARPSLLTADLSFISIGKVLSVFTTLLTTDGEIIALVKPQFEAGRTQVGKKGVVRSPAIHEEVLRRVLLMGPETGLGCLGLTYSPVLGPEGNIEFLVYWKKGVPDRGDLDPEAVVAEAWENFKPKKD